ncbi:MAG: protoporphyrinogen oxidase, partial [Deltaproteobacteria bacterium]
MTDRRCDVAVVGGGITGLTAAHALLARAPGTTVVLLEATDRLGGTIATEHTGGFVIETGADAFLTEKPWALDLCDRLGMAERLVGTREGDRRTYVVHAGRLVPLPEGFMLLAPTNLWALAASPLFSWRGKLRMALDLVLPRRSGEQDESLGAFVRRRFGREALER